MPLLSREQPVVLPGRRPRAFSRRNGEEKVGSSCVLVSCCCARRREAGFGSWTDYTKIFCLGEKVYKHLQTAVIVDHTFEFTKTAEARAQLMRQQDSAEHLKAVQQHTPAALKVYIHSLAIFSSLKSQ